MAHPFFNNSSFPHHRPEAKLLLDCLKSAITQPSKIDLLYKQSALGPGLPPLNLSQDIEQLWKTALENLIAHGGLRKLLDALASEFSYQPDIKGVIQAVLDAKGPVQLQLFDDLIVLDRAQLRDNLTRLASESSLVKILLVRGDPQSGKSHGRHLFHRLAQDHGARDVYLDANYVATVEETVDNLFIELGSWAEIPPRDTSYDAWYRVVCNKLHAIAAHKNIRLWVAIDDLGLASDGAPRLDSRVRDFCNQFARMMVNPAFSRWFRLMLIHYPEGPIPTNWHQDHWVEERTSIGDIKQEHVADLLREWVLNRQHILNEDDINARALSLLAQIDAAPASDTPRLRRLNEALRDTLRYLAEQP